MENTFKVDIQSYINLYNRGMKLDRIKPLENQTYRLFKESGFDIRIVNRKETYKNPLAFEKIKFFTLANEHFYMIPVTTVKETIVGFILRGVLRKDYSTVSRSFSGYEKQVPLVFGFGRNFLNFDKQCDKNGRPYPLLLCEGSKDCIMLRKIYPYTLAVNTSALGINAQILRNVSDSFLLAYDNDKSGQDGISEDKRVLRSLGAYVDSVKLHDGFKDCADYLDHPKEFSELTKQIKRKLKDLYNIER